MKYVGHLVIAQVRFVGFRQIFVNKCRRFHVEFIYKGTLIQQDVRIQKVAHPGCQPVFRNQRPQRFHRTHYIQTKMRLAGHVLKHTGHLQCHLAVVEIQGQLPSHNIGITEISKGRFPGQYHGIGLVQ